MRRSHPTKPPSVFSWPGASVAEQLQVVAVSVRALEQDLALHAEVRLMRTGHYANGRALLRLASWPALALSVCSTPVDRISDQIRIRDLLGFQSSKSASSAGLLQ